MGKQQAGVSFFLIAAVFFTSMIGVQWTRDALGPSGRLTDGEDSRLQHSALRCNGIRAVQEGGERELRVITYNGQFRDPAADSFVPGWPNTRKRAEAIGRAVACYDIVAIQEAFREDRRAQIVQAAEEVGVHCGKLSQLPSGHIFDVATGPMFRPRVSYAPGRDFERMIRATYNLFDGLLDRGRNAVPVENSGLLLLSRYPIISVDQHTYTPKAGFDAWAKKGALHAVVCRSGQNAAGDCLDVFVTHLQAGVYRDERLGQVNELAHFIRTTRSSCPDRTALVMGDFNINGNADQWSDANSQYSFLSRSLRQAVPTIIDLWPYHHTTSSGATNRRRNKRIDYIFMTEGLGTTSQAVEVNEFPTDEQVSFPPNALDFLKEIPKGEIQLPKRGQRRIPFLSDHAGVEARVVWEHQPLQAVPFQGL